MLYLAHVLLAHPKLIVSQQEGPNLLPDLMLYSSIINQPEQLQLLVVLHKHTHRNGNGDIYMKDERKEEAYAEEAAHQ